MAGQVILGLCVLCLIVCIACMAGTIRDRLMIEEALGKFWKAMGEQGKHPKRPWHPGGRM